MTAPERKLPPVSTTPTKRFGRNLIKRSRSPRASLSWSEFFLAAGPDHDHAVDDGFDPPRNRSAPLGLIPQSPRGKVTDFRQFATQDAAKIRMRDRDQRLTSFPQRFSVEINHAVFGDHPMHMTAGGHHAGAGIELGDDARHLSAHRLGR